MMPVPILSRHGSPAALPQDPWRIWQPVDQPSPYTCGRCGQKKTGERFVALDRQGTIVPGLPAAPSHVVHALSRVTERIVCPSCRWPKPKPAEQPKRRKTELD